MWDVWGVELGTAVGVTDSFWSFSEGQKCIQAVFRFSRIHRVRLQGNLQRKYHAVGCGTLGEGRTCVF